MKKHIIILISLLSADTMQPLSLKSLYAPFTTEQEEEIISKEYEVNPDCAITLDALDDDIIVKSWNHNKIMLEAKKVGPLEELRETAIHTKIQPHQVTISTHSKYKSNTVRVRYTLIVPHKAHLIVKNHKGSIKIKNIKGPVNAFAHDGPIIIQEASNTVVAKSPNNTVTVKQQTLPTTASIFIEAGRGAQFHASRNMNAHIHAKTLNGVVTSQIYLTLDPLSTQLNKDAWARMKKDVKATLGSGGAPITIDVTKGDIEILEY